MKPILYSVLLLIALKATAQDSLVLKDDQLKKLIAQSVANYPKIKELEIQLKANDVQDELIRTNYKPNISGDGSVALMAPVPSFNLNGNKLQFAPYDNYNFGVSLRQVIADFGKTRSQLMISQANKQLQSSAIDLSRNAVAYQTAQSYYAILFLNKAIQVQQDQIKVLQENEKLIEVKRKNGDALEYDLLTTQVRIANAQNSLKDLGSQQEQQYIVLKLLTGSDQHGALQPTDNNDFDLIQQADNVLAKSLEAEQINQQLNLLQVQNASIKYTYKPSVFGSLSGGIKNGYQPIITQWRPNAMASVGISVPIYSGGRQKLQAKLNQVSIDAAKQSLNTLEKNITKELERVNEHFHTLEAKSTNQDILVSQAERAYQLAQVRFKEGLITSVELITTQNAVESAKLQQVQLKYEMQLDRMETHKIAGHKIW